MLAIPVPLELLQSVARWRPKIVYTRRSIQESELSERSALNIGPKLLDGLALKEALSITVSEALDHARIVAHYAISGKR